MTTGMRIRRIDCYLNHQPFRVAFVSLHAERREASGVLLRLESDTGSVGWGESTPREYVSGETCDSVIAQIENRFAPALFDAEVASLGQLRKLLETLAAWEHLPAPVVGSSALGAVDLALWDLWGHACALPAYRFFAQESQPLPPLSLSAPIMPPAQIRQFYPLADKMGITRYKLVLSADVEENVSRLAMLRELAGERATIAVDANGQLTPSQLLAMLLQL